MSYLVKSISFCECVGFWQQSNHFNDPNKRYLEYVQTLGAHERTIRDPKRQCYGLFSKDELIGVTQLTRWNEKWLRYRTIHIKKKYRGSDLGWYLIKTAFERDWSDETTLFGWVKKDHIKWSKKHGFVEVDSELVDDHIGMIRQMNKQ